jgi:hypothetical protein
MLEGDFLSKIEERKIENIKKEEEELKKLEKKEEKKPLLFRRVFKT